MRPEECAHREAFTTASPWRLAAGVPEVVGDHSSRRDSSLAVLPAQSDEAQCRQPGGQKRKGGRDGDGGYLLYGEGSFWIFPANIFTDYAG